MRIAFVVGSFPKLSETFILQQIIDLIDLGHDVRIFALGNPGEALAHSVVSRYRLLERTRYLSYRFIQLLGGIPDGVATHVDQALQSPKLPKALAQRLAHGSQGVFDVIYCHFGDVPEHARQLQRVGFLSGQFVAVFHAYDVTLVLRERGDRFYAALFDEAARLLPNQRVLATKADLGRRRSSQGGSSANGHRLSRATLSHAESERDGDVTDRERRAPGREERHRVRNPRCCSRATPAPPAASIQRDR